MLPTFIIIGAMKSGTTSLYRYLAMHPEISMSAEKELNFFIKERNFGRGIEWYGSNFTGVANAYGEASPNYTKHPVFEGVPQRMHDMVPDAKLIYILRDPIDRIISHYVHNCSTSREKRKLPDALSDLDECHYVRCSKYYMQLERFLQYYAKEQILVLTAEALRHDRETSMKTVLRFLEVDETFSDADYSRMFHSTLAKTQKRKLGRQLDRLGVTKVVTHMLPTRFVLKYRKMTEYACQRPTLDMALEQRMIACLKDDVAALRAFTGQDFGRWRL